MRRSILSLFPILLLLPAASAPAGIQVHAYRIDTGSSQAIAKVAFFGLASKTARFGDISGDIGFAPAQLADTRITVSIDARTLTASDSVTEKRLKGNKFFDVARYPTVRFVGSKMVLQSATAGTLSGTLTARGISRPVNMAVTFSMPPTRARGGESFTLTGKTSIDRRDFGMTAYPAIVGRKVNIALTAKLVGN